MLKKYFYPVAVAVLLAVMFVLMFFSAKTDSMIVDEDAHIPAGFSYITTGDYRLNPEHPPLIKDLAAIPLLLSGQKFPYEYWKSNADGKTVNNQWQVGWRFIYEYGNDADKLILLARIPEMILALLFGLLVYQWAKELYGKRAGIFALVLFAFNTNIIAHSRYVTTDMGISFAFFLCMYLVYKYLKKPNIKTLLLASLGFGVVLITKFSAAIIAPSLIIAWVLKMFKKEPDKKEKFLEKVNANRWFQRAWAVFVSFGVVAVLGVLFMWIFYIPHTINMPTQVQKDLINESNVGLYREPLLMMSENPVTKPLAQWILGFAMVSSHVEGGHDAFLLGQVSNQGWWYYYPVAIALKTQIAFFVLVILSFALWRKLDKRKDWFTEVYLWILPVVLIAFGMYGKIDLGIRYMLPIYAFIFVFISKLAYLFEPRQYAHLWQNGVKSQKTDIWVKIMTPVIGILFLWYVLVGILTFPFYLSYFNEFVGGYQNGNKYLTDSNLDWGQDNKRLGEWVRSEGIEKIYVDVFPGPMPARYYLGDRMIEWHVQDGRPRGYFAVSATFYRSSVKWRESNNNMDYTWLEGVKPIKNLGGSILIYDLR